MALSKKIYTKSENQSDATVNQFVLRGAREGIEIRCLQLKAPPLESAIF